MEVDPLRARTWDDYVGQEAHKAALNIRIDAAIEDNRPLDHILVVGPPGTGKSTLASIIASRVNDPIKVLVMPLKPQIIMSELRQFEGGILFLDEIHRQKGGQEDLLTLLWEGYFQLSGGQRVDVGWLTVIGATTEEENVIPPLHQRFMTHIKLDPYSTDEMTQIVQGMADRAEIELDHATAESLGHAAAGVPRIAERLVLAARDLYRVRGEVIVADVLTLCRIDPSGLTENHLAYLNALRMLGGVAGLATISTMIRLHETVIRDLERLLLERGYVILTARGRELTSKGWNYGKETVTSRRNG